MRHIETVKFAVNRLSQHINTLFLARLTSKLQDFAGMQISQRMLELPGLSFANIRHNTRDVDLAVLSSMPVAYR